MKKIILTIFISTFLSCEEVIDLNLNTQKKEMVVDAAIDWEKGTTGNVQKIKLSYTSDYYSNQESEIISAHVQVTTNTETFSFVETSKGEYICNDFVPTLNKDYYLSITYDGKNFISQGKMLEAPNSSNIHISQLENGGFLGNEIMLRIDFDTDPTQENNFVGRIKASGDKQERYFAIDDKYFTAGKFLFFIIGKDEKFKKDDTVDITLYRVTKEYCQIFELLSNISLENAAPFVFPARVYGNVINKQNPKENPLGAFRVAQYSHATYTIK